VILAGVFGPGGVDKISPVKSARMIGRRSKGFHLMKNGILSAGNLARGRNSPCLSAP